MGKLSLNEKSVLRQLEINSRIPFSKIGKRTKKSQQRVSYTVTSLHNKGIIKNFFTLIDYSKLGVLSFRVFFKISHIRELPKLISYLAKRQDTFWISTCGGKYDLICTFFSENVSKFNKNLREIIETFPELIHSFDILTTIVIRNFGRKYLIGPDIQKTLFIGGDRQPEQIDDMDKKILLNISKDARINSVDLAKKIDTTAKTIISRIKKLEKNEIINGYKPLLNLNKMGFKAYLLLIKFHNLSIKLENKLVNFLRIQPNVVNLVKTLGEWDIEIEIEIADNKDFRDIEFEIREKFSKLIQEIVSIPIYESYKKNFFPQFLIEN